MVHNPSIQFFSPALTVPSEESGWSGAVGGVLWWLRICRDHHEDVFHFLGASVLALASADNVPLVALCSSLLLPKPHPTSVVQLMPHPLNH